ncbi:MAG: SHOCT domain-containing protein [Planctomycetota bacterium]
MDLSALEDQSEGGVRRLRQILIGCGSCRANIKVPESKFGQTTTCASCKALLKVDAFDISKAKGDLIDMTHLELEPADPLLDGGAHGSSLGGSSIQLEGGASGAYELSTPAGGSEATDSQSQMRELKELNELKHSGQISNDEYRERKKEIYSGKSLAVQAMSRSADGSGNRPVLKANSDSALLPGPVKALIALAIVGGIGFAGWSVLSGSDSSSQTQVAQRPVTPSNDTTQLDDDASGADDTNVADAAGVDDASADQSADTSLTDNNSQLEDAEPAAPAVTMRSLDDEPGIGSIGVEKPSDEPEIEMMVSAWKTDWPEFTVPPGDTRAIGKACELIKRIESSGDRALIGVAVGPAVDNLENPAYAKFRQEMSDILTDTAKQEGVFDDLTIRTSDRTAELGGLQTHRLHVTSKSDRAVRATVLTGVQDGYSVAYWFAGARGLYKDFLETVGQAEFSPVN